MVLSEEAPCLRQLPLEQRVGPCEVADRDEAAGQGLGAQTRVLEILCSPATLIPAGRPSL
jgi:hypothetical protein